MPSRKQLSINGERTSREWSTVSNLANTKIEPLGLIQNPIHLGPSSSSGSSLVLFARIILEAARAIENSAISTLARARPYDPSLKHGYSALSSSSSTPPSCRRRRRRILLLQRLQEPIKLPLRNEVRHDRPQPIPPIHLPLPKQRHHIHSRLSRRRTSPSLVGTARARRFKSSSCLAFSCRPRTSRPAPPGELTETAPPSTLAVGGRGWDATGL